MMYLLCYFSVLAPCFKVASGFGFPEPSLEPVRTLHDLNLTRDINSTKAVNQVRLELNLNCPSPKIAGVEGSGYTMVQISRVGCIFYEKTT